MYATDCDRGPSFKQKRFFTEHELLMIKTLEPIGEKLSLADVVQTKEAALSF